MSNLELLLLGSLAPLSALLIAGFLLFTSRKDRAEGRERERKRAASHPGRSAPAE